MQKDKTKISPGYDLEKKFIDKILSNDLYVLPEYVNGFLLARDIEIEFKGIDHDIQAYAIQRSSTQRLSGNYGCFKASSTYANSGIHAESTMNGLRIHIPGAQSIGYYTTILPCFPRNSCKDNGFAPGMI